MELANVQVKDVVNFFNNLLGFDYRVVTEVKTR